MKDMYAVFAIDPGGTTGTAMGLFDKNAETVEETFHGMFMPMQSSLTGSAREQAIELGKRWRRFYHQCHLNFGIEVHDIHMVVEDFALVANTAKARAGDDPLISVKIAWMLYGYRVGQLHEWDRNNNGPSGPVHIHWQQPAAMSFATNDRLKRLKVYRSNRAHENAAWKHIAYFVNQRLLQQGSQRASRARTRVRA